ncbi:MAG: hypothetical protein HC905_21745 [Bacteroidales bacterium]|nr:hypothetical protein [Bacteroidales bacterium]
MSHLALSLSQRNDTVVFAENLSNIAGENIISSSEPLLAALNDSEKALYQPHLLITIGEGLVSKRLKQYFRTFPPVEHWHFTNSAAYIDTFRCLSFLIDADACDVLNILMEERSQENNDYKGLKAENNQQQQLHNEFINKLGLVDLRVSHEILGSIPNDTVIHLANSTPVRYAQLTRTKKELTYFCNRGTSGIDGCLSTAAGSAYVSGKNTWLISGDLAFLYDSNALWNDYIKPGLKIIVINNNGGNIFSLIDTGSEMDKARRFFETPHRVKIKSLTEAFGIKYISCDDLSDLHDCLDKLRNSDETCLLEIRTDAKENTKAFKAYYQFIKSTLI